jgi:putative transposase
MGIDKEILDKLLTNYQKPEDIIGENGLLKQLTKALVERAMEAELTTHLGYEKHDPVGYGSGNSRNGKSRKRLQGDFGEVEIEVPRDRSASFEPQIVPKGETRFAGFSMTRFFPCTHAACRRARSRVTCKRSMAWKSALH